MFWSNMKMSERHNMLLQGNWNNFATIANIPLTVTCNIKVIYELSKSL